MRNEEFRVLGQLFAKQASKQASKQANLKKKFLQNSCSFEKIANKVSTERCFKGTKRFMVFWAIGSFLSSFLLCKKRIYTLYTKFVFVKCLYLLSARLTAPLKLKDHG